MENTRRIYLLVVFWMHFMKQRQPRKYVARTRFVTNDSLDSRKLGTTPWQLWQPHRFSSLHMSWRLYSLHCRWCAIWISHLENMWGERNDPILPSPHPIPYESLLFAVALPQINQIIIVVKRQSSMSENDWKRKKILKIFETKSFSFFASFISIEINRKRNSSI